MAIAKTAVNILTSQSCAAGGTRAAPSITGTGVDVSAYDGGDIGYSITNGTAPGVGGAIMFQQSPDNTKWYDYFLVGGDVAASTAYSGTIWVDPGVKFLRALCYQNTTNPVTVEASFVGVVRS